MVKMFTVLEASFLGRTKWSTACLMQENKTNHTGDKDENDDT